MHLLVAMVWLFLSGNTTLGGFLVGLVSGFALLALFRRAIRCETYVRRVSSLLIFVVCFARELVVSSLRIARVALQPGAGDVKGCFVRYEAPGLSDLEVMLLAHCISLTPGTTTVTRTEDRQGLILHAFAGGSPDELQRSIDATLKEGILAFTR
jgi:multisubunit Na+/H+ antiporter MnhE subunit